jgi:ribonuclease PH
MRSDNRQSDQLRPVSITRRFTTAAPGSVLIQAGQTMVLCTASVEPTVPAWLAGQGRGWITAEYSMLPGSTNPRKQRERMGRLDGRTSEIQRLIGRSLRAVCDLHALGERSIVVDCDVLQADGGTRTMAITGALIALVDALESIRHELPNPQLSPLQDTIAAVSVGVVDGQPLLDLDYGEDARATVDMNVAMTGGGRLVEVQASGEMASFTEAELQALLSLARQGIVQLTAVQRQVLGQQWPFG